MCRVRVDMSESETKELITQLTAILEMNEEVKHGVMY